LLEFGDSHAPILPVAGQAQLVLQISPAAPLPRAPVRAAISASSASSSLHVIGGRLSNTMWELAPVMTAGSSLLFDL